MGMTVNKQLPLPAELKAEYQEILKRLDELEQQGVIGAFETGERP